MSSFFQNFKKNKTNFERSNLLHIQFSTSFRSVNSKIFTQNHLHGHSKQQNTPLKKIIYFFHLKSIKNTPKIHNDCIINLVFICFKKTLNSRWVKEKTFNCLSNIFCHRLTMEYILIALLEYFNIKTNFLCAQSFSNFLSFWNRIRYIFHIAMFNNLIIIQSCVNRKHTVDLHEFSR